MAGVPISMIMEDAYFFFPGHFYEDHHLGNERPATSAGEAWLDRAISIQEGPNEVNADCEGEECNCHLIAEIECEVCPKSETEVFYMICCGTVQDALFVSGNCCIQKHAESDERRLGKCTSAKRGFFRQPGRNHVLPTGED